MEQKEFIKAVIKEADKRLERSDTLDVDEWALYKDYPTVEIEDLRYKEEMDGDTNISVDISVYLESEDIFEAARKVIHDIKEYALTHDNTTHEDTLLTPFSDLENDENESPIPTFEEYDDYDEDEYECDNYENYRD